MFKRKANEVFSELSKLIPDKNFELTLNAGGKPKRGKTASTGVLESRWWNYATIFISGSFEIYVSQSGSEKKKQVWSGVGKGPPRKEKFPDAKALVDAVLAAAEA